MRATVWTVAVGSISRLAVALVIPVLSGCVATQRAYDGPPRARDQVAILECASGVLLRSIDGKRKPPPLELSNMVGSGLSAKAQTIESDWCSPRDGNRFRYEILPGRYELRVGYYASAADGRRIESSLSFQTVDFTAEGGHLYVVHALSRDAEWIANVEERTSIDK